jgi:hypothetical protein
MSSDDLDADSFQGGLVLMAAIWSRARDITGSSALYGLILVEQVTGLLPVSQSKQQRPHPLCLVQGTGAACMPVLPSRQISRHVSSRT